VSTRTTWHRVRRIGLATASLLVVLVALELMLRWWPMLLGLSFANGALSHYTSRSGGIYYADRALHMHFMIPNHNADMFYNGYRWKHHTDALGFRNAPLHVPTDVILLGDSFVYGHGVDFEHTMGAYLERQSGLHVANLGQQGNCAFQETYVLAAYVDLLKPRFVVHVFTPNDIDDLYVFLSDAAMQAFIAQPVDRITFPPRTDPERLLRERENALQARSLGKRAEQDLYLMKMARWIGYEYRQWRTPPGASPLGRRANSAEVNADAGSLGWRYTEHALLYMKRRSERAGARFLMAPVAQGRQLEILRGIAARHGIDLVDPTPLFAGASFLPNDGHFTPYGARTLAELTAASIERLR
jgi:hypothetical protein